MKKETTPTAAHTAFAASAAALGERLGLPRDVLDRLPDLSGDETARDLACRLTERGRAEEAFREARAYLAPDPDGFRMLALQLDAAARLHSVYRARGVPDEVYFATMDCFPRFLEETRRIDGRPAFDRDWWTWRQTSMLIVRLGALEFELHTTRDGERFVSVHIPTGADLSPAAVDDSLSRARAYLAAHEPAFVDLPFVCHSWLLSCELYPLLSSASRIRSFADRFAIRPTADPSELCRWLFSVPSDTPSRDLPEDTSLRRTVKARLLAGESFFDGFGRLKTP